MGPALCLAVFLTPSAAASPLYTQREGDITWVPVTQIDDAARVIEKGDTLFFAMESGVASWERRTGRFHITPLDHVMGNHGIVGLEEVGDKIWVINRRGGVDVFDPKERKMVQHLFVGEELEGDVKFGYNGNMTEVFDPYGNAIWFGHFLNADRFDVKTGSWTSLNPAIKAAGIGRPGSSPRISVREEGVWIENQGHASSTGGTLFCDHAANNCRLAERGPPPEPERPMYEHCAASARFAIAACGQKLVRRQGESWEVLWEVPEPFSYPINWVDEYSPNGPFVACQEDSALMIAKGRLQTLDFSTLELKPVTGGEGFTLDGYWGTERDGDLLRISKDYDGCDTVPPSQYYTYNYATNELVKESSGAHAGQMQRQGTVCDIRGGRRVTAKASGLQFAALVGPTLAEQAKAKQELQELDRFCAAHWRFRTQLEPLFEQFAFLNDLLEEEPRLEPTKRFKVLSVLGLYTRFLASDQDGQADMLGGPGPAQFVQKAASSHPDLSWMLPERIKERRTALQLAKKDLLDLDPAVRRGRQYNVIEFEKLLLDLGWSQRWEERLPSIPADVAAPDSRCVARGGDADVREQVKFMAEMEASMRFIYADEVDQRLADLRAARERTADARADYERLWTARLNLGSAWKSLLSPRGLELFPEETNELVVRKLLEDPKNARFSPEEFARTLKEVDDELKELRQRF